MLPPRGDRERCLQPERDFEMFRDSSPCPGVWGPFHRPRQQPLSWGLLVRQKDLCGCSGAGIATASTYHHHPPLPAPQNPTGILRFPPHLQPCQIGGPWDSPGGLFLRKAGTSIGRWDPTCFCALVSLKQNAGLSSVRPWVCSTATCFPLPAAGGKRHRPSILGDP